MAIIVINPYQYAAPIGPSADPYSDYVSLLLHGNGTNGSTAFTDSSSNNHTVTANGNAQISTTQSKFGGASMYFDGSGDYLSLADSEDWNFASGNFTVEAFIYPLSFANEPMIVGQWSGDLGGTGLNWALMFDSSSNGYLRLITSSNGSSVLFDLSTSTYSLTLNKWSHIAAVRNGNTFTLYVDGISRATTINSSSLYNATNLLTIGSESSSIVQYFNGYIDDLRITKGIARYTANFTPPTAELPDPSDPDFDSVSLLLHGDGTNGSTTFIDSSNNSHTVTPSGDAQISTTQSKFGGASMYFDGSGDYLAIGPDSGLSLGSGDFTVEAFIYLASLSSQIASSRAVSSVSDLYWTFGVGSTGQLVFQSRGTNQYFARSATSAITTNTWYHVAAVRQNNIITVYVNGVAGPTTVNDGGVNLSESYVGVGIFNYPNYVSDFDGYIDDLRITKGVARYTSNFTPPTAPLPDETPPIVTDGLVLHLDAGDSTSYPGTGTTWFDLTTNSNDGTISGATYSSADGGSLSFDGNDYVSCGNPSPLQITQGTISAWVKTSSPGSAYRGIIAKPQNYGLFAKNGYLIAYDWGNSVDRATPINIADGNWKNVVMSFTENTGTPSNNAIIYLNGSSVLTTTIKFVNNSINFEIGSGVGGQYINGNIAQVTIYNRPLTQSEVTQNFDALKKRYGL